MEVVSLETPYQPYSVQGTRDNENFQYPNGMPLPDQTIVHTKMPFLSILQGFRRVQLAQWLWISNPVDGMYYHLTFLQVQKVYHNLCSKYSSNSLSYSQSECERCYQKCFQLSRDVIV